MQLIEENDFFELTKGNRTEATKKVLSQLKDKGSLNKGVVVRKLHQEDIYKQKKDCKDFLKNLIRCRNVDVHSKSRSQVCLGKKKEVRTA